MNTYLIKTKSDLTKLKREFDKTNNNYLKRNFMENPVKFPCIAISTFKKDGDLGEIELVEGFVYLSDFN